MARACGPFGFRRIDIGLGNLYFYETEGLVPRRSIAFWNGVIRKGVKNGKN
jgi:hypothetical protein